MKYCRFYENDAIQKFVYYKCLRMHALYQQEDNQDKPFASRGS